MPLPAFVLPVGLGGLALGGLYWYLHRPHAGVGPAPDNVPPAPPPKQPKAAPAPTPQPQAQPGTGPGWGPPGSGITPTYVGPPHGEAPQAGDPGDQPSWHPGGYVPLAAEEPGDPFSGGDDWVPVQPSAYFDPGTGPGESPQGLGGFDEPPEPSEPAGEEPWLPASLADYIPDVVPDVQWEPLGGLGLDDLGDLFSGQRDAALSHDPTVRRFLARKRKRRNI